MEFQVSLIVGFLGIPVSIKSSWDPGFMSWYHGKLRRVENLRTVESWDCKLLDHMRNWRDVLEVQSKCKFFGTEYEIKSEDHFSGKIFGDENP